MQEQIDVVIRDARPDIMDALRDYVTRRLSFALRSVAHRVRRVTVRFSDLNGPRRGVDSRCSMMVALAGGRTVFVDATTAWPFASASLAAHRVSKALHRDVERGRSRR